MTELYISPEMHVALFDETDVLTTSGNYGDGVVYDEYDSGNVGEEDPFHG